MSRFSEWIEERLAFEDELVLTPTDVIIAVGTDVSRDGRIASPQSAATVQRAVELYRQGWGRNLLLVGGYRAIPDGPTEAEAMAALTDGHIPANRLWLETVSATTVANARMTLPIMRVHRWRSAVIVAQRWHARRVKATFAKAWQGSGISFAVLTAASPYGGGSQHRFDSFWRFLAWDSVAFIGQKLRGQG